MANQTSSQAEVAAPHHDAHAPSSARVYIQIFVVLFVITMVEVFASYLDEPPINLPTWVEITTLLVLSVLKGVLVVMFYMHLRFDSRWFTTLFSTGITIAVLMAIVFLLLWSYKASIAGGLVV
ncbi:MAG TPA: cytochrome C oxidase subunit IV family protein [Herpetosiphonaceae bacterium]